MDTSSETRFVPRGPTYASDVPGVPPSPSQSRDSGFGPKVKFWFGGGHEPRGTRPHSAPSSLVGVEGGQSGSRRGWPVLSDTQPRRNGDGPTPVVNWISFQPTSSSYLRYSWVGPYLAVFT